MRLTSGLSSTNRISMVGAWTQIHRVTRGAANIAQLSAHCPPTRGSAPEPSRFSLLRKGPSAFLEVLRPNYALYQIQGIVELERLMFRDHFRVPQQLLDGWKQQGRAVRKLPGYFASFGQGLALGYDMIGQAPVFRLRGVHPAASQQELDRDVVGYPPPQFDRTGVRQYSDVDFRKCKFRVLL